MACRGRGNSLRVHSVRLGTSAILAIAQYHLHTIVYNVKKAIAGLRPDKPITQHLQANRKLRPQRYSYYSMALSSNTSPDSTSQTSK